MSKKKPATVPFNKVARFQRVDGEQMIQHWRQLADLHQQQGNQGEVSRLERLANQMQGILDHGLPTSIRTIALPGRG